MQDEPYSTTAYFPADNHSGYNCLRIGFHWDDPCYRAPQVTSSELCWELPQEGWPPYWYHSATLSSIGIPEMPYVTVSNGSYCSFTIFAGPTWRKCCHLHVFSKTACRPPFLDCYHHVLPCSSLTTCTPWHLLCHPESPFCDSKASKWRLSSKARPSIYAPYSRLDHEFLGISIFETCTSLIISDATWGLHPIVAVFRESPGCRHGKAIHYLWIRCGGVNGAVGME